MTRSRYGKEAEVALRSPVVREELPWPWVQYPNQYGTFLAFSQKEDGEQALCACTRGAVENHLRIARMYPGGLNANPLRMAPLESGHFPDSIARASLLHKNDPLSEIRFEPKLCHRCNLAVPSMRWCVDMYGGLFKQCYGWYINQSYFRWGIQPLWFHHLKDACPPELESILREFHQTYSDAARRRVQPVQEDGHREEVVGFMEIDRAVGKLRQKIHNAIENITRQEFGIRKIGDAWVGESLLHMLVCRIFPGEEILRHHRPDWLEGLEADIFLPGRRLAIEYQGQQHYHPVEAWGGEEALDDLQKRDARKKRLCKKHAVCLIAIDYTEPLIESHIRARIDGEIQR